MLLFKATDSSMVEGDCQIQMGRFVSFLQVTIFFKLADFFLTFSWAIYLFIQDRVLLGSLDCSGAHCLDYTGLRLIRGSLPQALHILRLKVCLIMSGWVFSL